MKRISVFCLLGTFLLMICSPGFCGEWYPVLIHTHTSTWSDGGNVINQLALKIQELLGSLRSDHKCAWINTDHFDQIVAHPGWEKGYPASIRAESNNHFVAIPGAEVGSLWHPEPNTLAHSHIVVFGNLDERFKAFVNCYSLGTGANQPIVDRLDMQQSIINQALTLGMLPVAAHPTQMLSGINLARSDNRFNMQQGFDGLCGVEHMNTLGPGQDDECVRWYLLLVSHNFLVFVTAGSDYHGTIASSIPDALLGSLDRVTWVYADDFSEESIICAISEGKTYAACNGAFFTDFVSDGGQNPGFNTEGVDKMTITALARLSASDVKIIVYRDGTEVARQEYAGERSYCNLNGGDDFQTGWTDTSVTPGSTYRYVVRVIGTTKLGEQTLLITSPITLRLRLPGQTASFFDAIKSGNLTTMESCLNTDPSLANARDQRGGYDFKVHSSKPLALSVACVVGSNDCVSYLLQHGAEPDCRLGAGEPGPLMEVALTGDVQKAQLLLDSGANINICTDGNNPLIWAIDSDHSELAKFLIEKGANVNLPGDSGVRPLKRAMEHSLDDVIKLLLARGAKE